MTTGFIGATAAPGLSFAPDGSAVSLVTSYSVTLSQRAKDHPSELPPPVKRDLFLTLVAAAEAADKPIVIYIRGFVFGNGEMVVDFNGLQGKFGYQLRPPTEEADLPTGNEVNVVHQAIGRAGENVLRLSVSLSYDGVDQRSGRFDINSIDIALGGAPENGAPPPQPPTK